MLGTYSLTYSLTHLLTHSPTHSLTHSPSNPLFVEMGAKFIKLYDEIYNTLSFTHYYNIDTFNENKPLDNTEDYLYGNSNAVYNSIVASDPKGTCALTHSLAYSLAFSLNYSLTHSLTHLLTHLLTYSLTCLLSHLITHSLG